MVPPVRPTSFLSFIVPALPQSLSVRTVVPPTSGSGSDGYVSFEENDPVPPCGEMCPRSEAGLVSDSLGPLFATGSTLFVASAMAATGQGEIEIAPSSAGGLWTDTGFLILCLSVFAVGVFLAAKVSRSLRRPEAKQESAPPHREISAQSPPRRTERFKITRPLPQPGAPEEAWSEAVAPMVIASIHDAPTGPLAIVAASPVMAAPEDVTAGHPSGTVETAMPDDPTKGIAVPHATERGTTIKIVEGGIAVPRGYWQGTGTEPIVMRRKTERLIETIDVISAASQKKEFAIEPPDWALSDHLDYLRGFRGPKSRGMIKPELLEAAIGFLEKNPLSVFRQEREALFVTAYLRFRQMGADHPFDLEREFGLFRQRPESSERIFEMELIELRALLKVEPSESNRTVVSYVLKKAGEDIRWLHNPMNRLLHLLCRRRAESLRPETLRKYPFDILSYWRRFSRP